MLRFSGITLLLLCLSMFFSSCSGTSTIGDGQVDAVEAASIQVAVGLAFAAKPETVPPAYAVSTAILALLPGNDNDHPVELSAIDTIINQEVDKLHLDPLTRQSFTELVALVKAKTAEQLSANEDVAARLVVVKDVIAIIQRAAAARLQMVET